MILCIGRLIDNFKIFAQSVENGNKYIDRKKLFYQCFPKSRRTRG